MTLVFYVLQLLCDKSSLETCQRAAISSLQLVEDSYYSQVAFDTQQAQEKACLVRIIFNEAASESLKGQQIVAQITLHRVKSGKFPNTICGNLKAKGAYSFYSSSTKERERKYPKIYHDIAEKTLQGNYSKLISPSITYFKVCKVKSKFFDTLVMTGRVGNHCLYREKNLIVNN
jgi:spore germination cell wall hydrolase CwlJ-like protein